MRRLKASELIGLPAVIKTPGGEYAVVLYDDLVDEENDKGLASRERTDDELTIRTVAGSEDRCYGSTNHPFATISLSRAQGLASFRNTLLHEALHAVEGPLGVFLEERQVWGLAAGLLALMRDNPDLVKFLTRSDYSACLVDAFGE
ncbi:MAG: hypothetical protein ACREYE_23570 [Gammaproteobacteria bacterium]